MVSDICGETVVLHKHAHGRWKRWAHHHCCCMGPALLLLTPKLGMQSAVLRCDLHRRCWAILRCLRCRTSAPISFYLANASVRLPHSPLIPCLTQDKSGLIDKVIKVQGPLHCLLPALIALRHTVS